MKTSIMFVCAVVLILSAWHTNVFAAFIPSRLGTDNQKLTAFIAINSQDYCHVDDDSFSVRMEVNVKLTNVSSRPVILSKRIENPEIMRIASDIESARRGDFESAPNSDRFVSENSPIASFGETPDEERFVVLEPSKSYDTQIVATVFASKRSIPQPGLIGTGRHLLQVAISTWPYRDYKNLSELERKWLTIGDLASGLIYTNFAEFRIPTKFKNPQCPPR
jgi:hypothetical protein